MTESVRSRWVVTELAADGSVERAATLNEASAPDGVLELGRDAPGLAYPDDEMADRQARLADTGTSIVLEDLAEGTGVWLRIAGSEGRALADGDQVWLGAQILVFRGAGTNWVIRHHGPDGRLRDSHPVPPRGFFIGRGSELVLDPDDAQLSRRHAQVAFVDDTLRFFDRGAQNGSFIRLRAPETISDGAEFRVATRRFRLEERPVEPEPTDVPSPGAREESVEESANAMGPSPDTASDAASDATFEEATVLNLPVDGESPEAEPVAPLPPARQRPGQGEFQPSLPRPASGLGARLRRLARRDATDGEERARPEATPDAADRTVAVPIAPAADPEEVEAPEARASAAEARAPSEPEPVETPLASDRVPLVIDSAEGSVSLEVEPGCTVLEAVQQAGLERGRPVDWECGDGGCGVCIVGVVEGADRMDPPDPASGEMQTIQITEQVAPDPTRYRLACLARVRGAVRLRKLT